MDEKRLGRPPKEEENRDKQMHLRVSGKMLDDIRVAAESEQSITDYVLGLIRKDLDLRSVSQEVASGDRTIAEYTLDLIKSDATVQAAAENAGVSIDDYAEMLVESLSEQIADKELSGKQTEYERER